MLHKGTYKNDFKFYLSNRQRASEQRLYNSELTKKSIYLPCQSDIWMVKSVELKGFVVMNISIWQKKNQLENVLFDFVLSKMNISY